MATKRTSERATLSAIAEACGVSTMTVSRAMREDSPVKAETREQILSVAEEIGYLGRSRIGRPREELPRSRQAVEVVIGLFDQQEHPFYTGLLAALERELKGQGHDCVIRTCDGSYESFLSLAETLRQTTPVGTIITGQFSARQLQTLLDIQPAALLVDNPGHPDLDRPFGYVAFDNVEAGRQATRHLLQAGRQRILLMKGKHGHFFSEEIEQGWREALRRADHQVDEALILEGNYDAGCAREVILQALAQGLKFDAVFTNDEMACGVLQALHARRLDVPGDVSVVGCDGLPVGLRVYPRLTTMVLDYDELGRQAIANLLSSDRRHVSPWRCRLVPRLAIRDSSIPQP